MSLEVSILQEVILKISGKEESVDNFTFCKAIIIIKHYYQEVNKNK